VKGHRILGPPIGKLRVATSRRDSETLDRRRLALFAGLASGQSFPDRPLRIIVPLPPGGSPDTIARTLATHLQTTWGQPIVVENRTGGSQNIGADAVAKSAPDGYTWLLSPDNVFVINPYIAKATSFDPLTDLTPVTESCAHSFPARRACIAAVNSVRELIAYAKAHPGELNFGSSGNGSPQRLMRSSSSSRRASRCITCPTRALRPRWRTCSPAASRSGSARLTACCRM